METNTKMINKVISTNTNTSWLKIIALITMTCDHIGKMFFPKITILQIVGRIAFPLFAYCLAVGCIYTYDIKKICISITTICHNFAAFLYNEI